ncbi:hypothetical protein CISIN_1g023542mg [Citrus sinensis]|uniref:RING-type E3 ubiquitin transferase n=1 Tax=Citrus sinensis TaxID=2711 RepID=A0A067E8D1_CITSI|nr:hypothetical protein CISIN_1g023542mg [Citrus sinensis]
MEEETIIISALSTLTPNKLKDLTHTILSLSDHWRRRLSAVISSPILFSLTLHHLHSLSLPNKTLLIARHLLFSLQLLTQCFPRAPPPHSSTYQIKRRDHDAVLLLLLLCEVHQQDPEALSAAPQAKWPAVLGKHFCESALSLSGIVGGAYEGAVLLPYVEMVTRCRRFVNAMGGGGVRGGEKEGRDVAAAVAAVVRLPSVDGAGADQCCVICKEEMGGGRDVCELPCKHLFHWLCILPWLKKRNTCPCCRFRLPTDDVFGEIERLWDALVKTSGGGSFDGE